MPIRYTTASTPPVTPPSQDAPPLALRVVLTQAGRRLELSTTGSPVPSGSGAEWKLQAAAEGFDDPQFAPVMDTIPGGYGAAFGGMQVPPREIFLPIFLDADGGDEWRAARRELDEVANPFLGDTTITVSTADGVSRTINARRKVDQPQGWATDTWSHTGWQKLGLLFEAADPWWRQVGGLDVEPWQPPSETAGFFGEHFFPMRVLSSGVFGADRPLMNAGQVEARPVYTINAADAVSSTTVEFEHIESGRSWTLDIDGLTGSVVVDTAAKTVTGPDGSDWWSRLAAPFDLWPLPIGSQTVRVTVTGSATGLTVTQTGDTLHFRAVQ